LTGAGSTGTRLIRTLAGLVTVQAVTGLLWSGAYRDSPLIQAAWLGNDLVTLVVAVPLLLVGLVLANRGETSGRLLVAGVLSYVVYNSAFYLLGATLNIFFPLYAVIFLIAILALLSMRRILDSDKVARAFPSDTPGRLLGAELFLIGVGLGGTWLAMWAAHVFRGVPTPVQPDIFRLVAALDLTCVVPALTVGGALLWRRKARGYVIAPIGSVFAALYLLVLSAGSAVAIGRGQVAAPGELPIWLGLFLLMAGIVGTLFANVDPSEFVAGDNSAQAPNTQRT
jgi:hypothetical protein